MVSVTLKPTTLLPCTDRLVGQFPNLVMVEIAAGKE